MMLRPPKIVLYVTNQAVVVSFWHGRYYQSCQVYKNQAAGHAAFHQTISEHKDTNIHVIVDIVEEECQLTLLPHVNGARREMLTRKLTQFSRNSVYKTAWFMHQEKTSRRENAYVLFALMNTDCLKGWMDILQSEQALLVGVTTLPMVSQGMVLSMKSVPPQLLVCERLSSGLRQSYLQDGHLRISRLTPMDSVLPAQLIDIYLAEIEKMRLYLLSQKIINDETALQIRLSAFQGVGNAVAKGLEQRGIECHIANRQNEMREHHLKQADVTRHPELLHMQWQANVSKSVNLAPVEMTKIYRHKRFVNRLNIGAAILMTMGLLASAHFFNEAYKSKRLMQPLLEQTAALLNKQAVVMKAHSEAEILSSGLKNIVEFAQTINHLPSSPLPVMQAVSADLAEEPSVVLNRMRWIQSEQLHIKGEENAVSMATTSQRDILNLMQIGFFNAEIKPFSGDYPMALATVNRLVNKIRMHSSVMSVQLLQAPVSVDSLSKLQGNTSEQNLVPASAKFKLKILLKPMERKG